jgi:hypothetical protein
MGILMRMVALVGVGGGCRGCRRSFRDRGRGGVGGLVGSFSRLGGRKEEDGEEGWREERGKGRDQEGIGMSFNLHEVMAGP